MNRVYYSQYASTLLLFLERTGFTEDRILTFESSSEERLSEVMASINSRDSNDHSHYSNWVWRTKRFKRLEKTEQTAFLLILRCILLLHYNKWSVLQECWERTCKLTDGYTTNTKLYRSIRLRSIDFILEENQILEQQTEYRYYSRIVGNICHKYKVKSLADWFFWVVEDFFITEFQRRKCKPTQRHKGYRDHGSLGPSSSLILREEERDQQLQKLLEQQEREKYKREHPKSNAISDLFDLI